MGNEKKDITVLILAKNESGNIGRLIDKIRVVIEKLRVGYEIIVIDGKSFDSTVSEAKSAGALVFNQNKDGFGEALKLGFSKATGVYILTLDADFTHHPAFINKMWAAKSDAEIVIASRYVTGGGSNVGYFRKILSRILNWVYAKALSVPVTDLSSNFRLYRRDLLKNISIDGHDFDALEEILVKIYCIGGRITEIPVYYMQRKEGVSNARLFKFGWQLLKTLFRLFKLRNSILSADYDERAFFSRIPLQRYWQRKRHKHIIDYSVDSNFVLDIGCGSSVILRTHPHVVGVDVSFSKLFYMRKYNVPIAEASVIELPFADGSFTGVIFSQVIEHLPYDPRIFSEIKRVLINNGLLIIGTPDYGRPWWPITEKIYKMLKPEGYADEHITQYTYRSLTEKLNSEGFQVLSHKYILGGELIIQAFLEKKPAYA